MVPVTKQECDVTIKRECDVDVKMEMPNSATPSNSANNTCAKWKRAKQSE